MDNGANSNNPYAAPSSSVADAADVQWQVGAPWRAVIWGVVSLPLLWLWLELSFPPVVSATFILAFLFGPAIWLLWPDLRAGGLRSISTGRLLLAVAAGLAVSFVAVCCLLTLAWLYFTLFEQW
jgi:hypothetical protein